MAGDRIVVVTHRGPDGCEVPQRVMQIWSRTAERQNYTELVLDAAPLTAAEQVRCDYSHSCTWPGERWRDPVTGNIYCPHHALKFDGDLPENSGAAIAEHSSLPAQPISKVGRRVDWGTYTGVIGKGI